MFSVVQQGFDAGGVAVERGQDERSVAVVVRQVEVHVSVEKQQ